MRIKQYSIRYVSLKEQEDEMLLFGQFLDDFYNAKSKENKYALIKEEPIFDEKNPVFMCMLACAVHKLSNDYNLKTPEWVFFSKYTLKEKYYAFNTENKEYQNFLENTTPVEYKSRNLIYGDSVLKRC